MEISIAVIVVGTIGLLASFASGFGAGFKFFLVYILGAAVLSWVLSAIARRQQDYLVAAGPQAVTAAVQDSFSGVGWKQVDGPGTFNFRARGLGMGSYGAKRPVVSVQIEDQADGTTAVSIWTSSWNSRMGMMALCDRVVSKRFWLGRKLAELSNTGAITAPHHRSPLSPSTHAGSTPSPSTSSDEQTKLADPGLPEDNPRQLAHLLMTSVGLSFLVYGPADAASCFAAFSGLSPVLLQTEGLNGSDFLGTLAGRPGFYWLCFEGPFGSAIAVCVSAEADSNFATEHIAMRLRDMQSPWQWGIGTVGGNVPAGFARIVESSNLVELHRLPGLQHLNPGPSTYPGSPAQPYVFPTTDTSGFASTAASAPWAALSPSAWAKPELQQSGMPTYPDYPAAQSTSPHLMGQPAYQSPPPQFASLNGGGNLYPDTTVSPPDRAVRQPSAPGLATKRLPIVIGAIAAVGVMIVASIVVTHSGDKSQTSTKSNGSSASSVSVNDVSACATPPQLQAQSTSFGTAGLTIATTITPTCSSGDLLTNSKFRVTAVDANGRDVASGIFDLSSSPIAVGSGGTSAEFTFPAGTYWRTADSITGSLSLTGHKDGSDSAPTTSSATVTTLSATAPGAPAAGTVDAAAQSALADIAAADRAYIDANLLNMWQPQLSSKYPGLFADGITWSAPDIVREHMELRQRFPSARLVWSADWPVYNSHPQWWITLSGVPFGSGEQANGWCASQGFDADHCYAKMLSHTMGNSETTLFR